MQSGALDGKKILITGGTGSFGKQMLIELLKYNPDKVIIFSRDEDKQHNMRQEFVDDRISFRIGDVRDYERLYEVTRNVDIIFHAAALKQVPYTEFHPYEAVKTNIIGAYNVLRAATINNVPKLISISTDKAVKPVNAMGMSKALQEKLLTSVSGPCQNTVISVVRYGNVLGSRGSVVPYFKAKLLKGQPLPVTHADMTRFLLTLPQAVNLVLYALENGRGGETFVRKAPACRIMDLAKVMAHSLTGKKDWPIEIMGIRPGEKVHEVLISEEERWRTTESRDFFTIKSQREFFDPDHMSNFDPGKYQGCLKEEYTSQNTERLDEDGILSLLKATGWT